jgi:hypothetical protein
LLTFLNPKQLKVLEVLLMCSVFRKFIKGFSGIAEPIIRLTKKGYARENKIEWDAEQQLAFIKLKENLASSPV